MSLHLEAPNMRGTQWVKYAGARCGQIVIVVGSEEVVKAHAEADDRNDNTDEDAEADRLPSGL